LNEPNKLIVTLPIKIGGKTLFNNPAPYVVLDTDYESYSVVYSCTELFLGTKYEIYWILSRTKVLNPETVERLMTDLKNQKINTSLFSKVDQSC
jgi:apolipoprotein D and lipocalin family protein